MITGKVRPDWDTYFLGIAEAVAQRADCTRRQVGAVLVDAEHRVVSTGYNGAPAGQPGCASAGACPRGRVGRDVVATRTSYTEGAGACIALHAERNALLYAARIKQSDALSYPVALLRLLWTRPSTDTFYVTCEPCPQCYEDISSAGIKRVIFPEGSD